MEEIQENLPFSRNSEESERVVEMMGVNLHEAGMDPINNYLEF